MLEWAQPWIAVLLPLPWLIRWALPPQPTEDESIRVPFFKDVAGLVEATGSPTGHSLLSALLLVLLWISLLVSAARPLWVGEPITLPLSGRDLMLAVDISGSMREDDMLIQNDYVTRIDAVKYVVRDFLKKRQGDRVGLILFGERSYLQTPLTFDRDTVGIQLSEALPGFAGQATAIGDAIGIAVRTLRERPSESRVLILLTDGANTAGSNPREAAEVAAEAEIRIHTIGVGADRKIERGIFGSRHEVNPSRDLDEQMLRHVADRTGGQFFRARDPEAMVAVYEAINQLEPVPEEKTYRPEKGLYHWPLGVALIAMLLLVLSQRRGLSEAT